MVQLCCRMCKWNLSCTLNPFNDLILCIPCGKLLHKRIGCVGGNFSAGEDFFATFGTGYDDFLKLYLLVVVVVAGKSDDKYPGVSFWCILKNNWYKGAFVDNRTSFAETATELCAGGKMQSDKLGNRPTAPYRTSGLELWADGSNEDFPEHCRVTGVSFVDVAEWTVFT